MSVLPKSQFQQLVVLLPTPKQRNMGRKRVVKEALIVGILQVLVNGVAWRKWMRNSLLIFIMLGTTLNEAYVEVFKKTLITDIQL